MENTTVELKAEDKIAKLKATLEGMELLGATIPQAVKDIISQELAVLEAKAIEDAEKIKAETISFYDQHKTEIIIVAALVVIHIAGLFGF